MRRLAGLLIIMTAFVSLPVVASEQDSADCNQSVDLDRAISGCSRLIEMGAAYRNHAATYFNRGNAYFDKGDFDRAVKDYDEALRLDPRNAAAYTNRGIA